MIQYKGRRDTEHLNKESMNYGKTFGGNNERITWRSDGILNYSSDYIIFNH